MAAGFVGHGHGTLDPPAEAEGFGQSHCQAAFAQFVTVGPQLGNQIALVGLLKGAGDLVSQTEAAAVVALRVVQGALEGTGIHSGRRV